MAEETKKGTDQSRGREDRPDPGTGAEDQIDEMLTMIDGGKSKEKPKEEVIDTEDESVVKDVEAEPESKPKTEDESKEAKSEKVIADESKVEESDEVDAIKAQMEAQAKLIETMAQMGIQVPTEKDTAVAVAESKSVLTEEKAPTEEIINFLGDGTNMEELWSDKDKLNKLLTEVYNRGMVKVYESMPGLIDKRARHLQSLQDTSNRFFDKNKDLLPYKTVVGIVANTMEAEHPDWKPDKVEKELPKEVRKLLNLKATVKKENKAKEAGLPGDAKGAREPAEPTKKKLSFEEQQQADMTKMIKMND